MWQQNYFKIGFYVFLLVLMFLNFAMFLIQDAKRIDSYINRPFYVMKEINRENNYFFSSDLSYLEQYQCVKFNFCNSFNFQSSEELRDKVIDQTKERINNAYNNFSIVMQITLFFLSAFLTKILSIIQQLKKSNESFDSWILFFEGIEFAYASFPLKNFYVYGINYSCCVYVLGLRTSIESKQWLLFFMRFFTIIYIIRAKNSSKYFIKYIGCLWESLFILFWFIFSEQVQYSEYVFYLILPFISQYILTYLEIFIGNIILIGIGYEYLKGNIEVYFLLQLSLLIVELFFSIWKNCNKRKEQELKKIQEQEEQRQKQYQQLQRQEEQELAKNNEQ